MRSFFPKFLLLCAALTGALMLGELASRTLTGERYALTRFRSEDYPAMDVFRPSSDLPYELVPNVPGSTNSMGMRGPERTSVDRANVFRIAVLADSIGMYGRYPDILEEMLNASEAGRYEVWNWSVSGFGLRDYATILESRALRHHPDLILIGLCLNDLGQTPVIIKDPQGAYHCYRPLRLIDGRLDNLLYARSYLYRILMNFLESPLPEQRETMRVRLKEDGGRALARIKKLAADRGIPVLGVVFPSLKPLAAYGDDELQNWRDIRALLEEKRLDYLDLSARLPEKERVRLRVVPEDVVHLNPAGSRLVAEEIRRQLRSRGLLDPRHRNP